MIYLSILKKCERARKQSYKHLKNICDKCGAYNHIDQGFCGICKSTHIRKATEKEKEQTLYFLTNIIDSRS
ncbi:MAG: hypothetical protein ACFFHV_02960 [Promethearchaeota archaeon]